MPQAKLSTADVLKRLQSKTLPQATIEDGGAAAGASPVKSLHVAVQGCCHGELDKIYAACLAHETKTGRKIDLLLCCGDFQSTRDVNDLRSMAVPDKYRVLGDFPAYYSGRKRAPVLTIFVGGNHEASNVLFDEYYGGYVAPNIFYLGHSGVVNVGGLRIAGLSGIFKGRDLYRDYPLPPYDQATVRAAYHVRAFEMDKLAALAGTGPIDIFLSHDWPLGITKYGNEAQLIRYKPFLAEDIRHNALGNPRTMDLLRLLQPHKWFAAHLHCRFTATVVHFGPEGVQGEEAGPGSDDAAAGFWRLAEDENNNNPPRATATPSSEATAAVPAPPPQSAAEAATTSSSPRALTEFLALDKCAKGVNFIEFFDIPLSSEASVEARRNQAAAAGNAPPLVPVADPAWLRIVKATHASVPWAGVHQPYSASTAARLAEAVRTAPPADAALAVPLTSTADLLERLSVGPLVPVAAPPRVAGVPGICGTSASDADVVVRASAADDDGSGSDLAFFEDV